MYGCVFVYKYLLFLIIFELYVLLCKIMGGRDKNDGLFGWIWDNYSVLGKTKYIWGVLLIL